MWPDAPKRSSRAQIKGQTVANCQKNATLRTKTLNFVLRKGRREEREARKEKGREHGRGRK